CRRGTDHVGGAERRRGGCCPGGVRLPFRRAVDRRCEARAGGPGPGGEAVSPDFSKGLVPAVVQNAETGKVLMLAYMDEESWKKTRERGRAWFQSRERGRWETGADDGNTMEVIEVRLDCD